MIGSAENLSAYAPIAVKRLVNFSPLSYTRNNFSHNLELSASKVFYMIQYSMAFGTNKKSVQITWKENYGIQWEYLNPFIKRTTVDKRVCVHVWIFKSFNFIFSPWAKTQKTLSLLIYIFKMVNKLELKKNKCHLAFEKWTDLQIAEYSNVTVFRLH